MHPSAEPFTPVETNFEEGLSVPQDGFTMVKHRKARRKRSPKNSKDSANRKESLGPEQISEERKKRDDLSRKSKGTNRSEPENDDEKLVIIELEAQKSEEPTNGESGAQPVSDDTDEENEEQEEEDAKLNVKLDDLSRKSEGTNRSEPENDDEKLVIIELEAQKSKEPTNGELGAQLVSDDTDEENKEQEEEDAKLVPVLPSVTAMFPTTAPDL
ncbi:uncharacterized protein LOC131069163 [Cryptomeria japonica]|uniref:uncharacterized protein LOC131069163 n=1 Tax=Cryptomeria japonica TaxID=3369 RepID=UPI0025AD2C7B|nr:uncharacterized protein LOC131069163 [Cryptomeria japonica]